MTVYDMKMVVVDAMGVLVGIIWVGVQQAKEPIQCQRELITMIFQDYYFGWNIFTQLLIGLFLILVLNQQLALKIQGKAAQTCGLLLLG